MIQPEPRLDRDLYDGESTEVGCILDCWEGSLLEGSRASEKLGIDRAHLGRAANYLDAAIHDFPLSENEWRWVTTLAALWLDLGRRGGFLGDIPPDVLVLAAESLIKCLPAVATEES
jgi:hypothetical protein